MKNDMPDAALNYIGDDLISEAADYIPPRKRRPQGVFKYSVAAACLAAVIGGAFAVISNKDGTASLKNPMDSSTLSFSISSASSSLPNADFTSWEDSKTLEDRLKDPNVIWADGQEQKSEVSGEPVKLGTTKISNALSVLIQEYPNAVFPVTVSFEPCASEAEMLSWKYCGTTIREIKNEIRQLAYEIASPMPEASGNETETVSSKSPAAPSAGSNAAEKIKQLKGKLSNAVYDYYSAKADSFKETFAQNGLEIYPVTEERFAAAENCNYFYCFATALQLENFKCKETEAFVFNTLTNKSSLCN